MLENSNDPTGHGSSIVLTILIKLIYIIYCIIIQFYNKENVLGGLFISSQEKKVFLYKTDDRTDGINALMEEFELDKFSDVAIKANYNSADPFPASTHIKTLESIIQKLNENNVRDITLLERSGMGQTHNVLQKMGVFQLAEDMNFKVSVLDELEKDEWIKIEKDGNHWIRGFYLPKLIFKSSGIIQTCCLKTHRFGGHFTLSLKNSVGLVSKKLPGSIYNYMAELHMSPHQRKMIAEINNHYDVDLVIMDALKAFINKGPETGEIAEPQLLVASNDRVAIDAVGVAILRNYGVKTNIHKGKIFELDQIKRAAELGIGAISPEDIDLIPLNEESKEDIENINQIFENE